VVAACGLCVGSFLLRDDGFAGRKGGPACAIRDLGAVGHCGDLRCWGRRDPSLTRSLADRCGNRVDHRRVLLGRVRILGAERNERDLVGAVRLESSSNRRHSSSRCIYLTDSSRRGLIVPVTLGLESRVVLAAWLSLSVWVCRSAIAYALDRPAVSPWSARRLPISVFKNPPLGLRSWNRAHRGGCRTIEMAGAVHLSEPPAPSHHHTCDRNGHPDIAARRVGDDADKPMCGIRTRPHHPCPTVTRCPWRCRH